MRVVAFANQKGGVGKTSTVLGIASAAQAKGLRVLVMDLDPQANATTALDPVDNSDGPTFDSFDVLTADSAGAVAGATLATGWGANVRVVGATLALQEAEADTRLGAEFRLRNSLEDPPDTDLVLIDCPPSVGRLTTNALVASDAVTVVTEPSAPALVGVAHVRDTIGLIRSHYNKALRTAGIIVNKAVTTATEPRVRLDELREAFGAEVLDPVIPTRTVVAEAMGAHAPIHAYLPSRAGDVQEAYDALLEHLMGLSLGRRKGMR